MRELYLSELFAPYLEVPNAGLAVDLVSDGASNALLGPWESATIELIQARVALEQVASVFPKVAVSRLVDSGTTVGVAFLRAGNRDEQELIVAVSNSLLLPNAVDLRHPLALCVHLLQTCTPIEPIVTVHRKLVATQMIQAIRRCSDVTRQDGDTLRLPVSAFVLRR